MHKITLTNTAGILSLIATTAIVLLAVTASAQTDETTAERTSDQAADMSTPTSDDPTTTERTMPGEPAIGSRDAPQRPDTEGQGSQPSRGAIDPVAPDDATRTDTPTRGIDPQDRSATRIDGERTAVDLDRTLPTGATSTDVTTRRARLAERLEVQQNARAESQEARAARFSTAAQERLDQQFTRYLSRLRAAVQRLTILTERIESRTTLLEEASEMRLDGVRTSLARARTLLMQATEDIEIARMAWEAVKTSDDPRTGIQDLREAIAVARETLAAVQTTLRTAVIELGAALSNTSETEAN